VRDAGSVNAFKGTRQSSGLIREAPSPAGHRVTLAVECSGYHGARPCYVITRHTKTGSPRDLRYVPVVYGVLDERRPTPMEQRRAEAEARALAIFKAFTQDITDAAGLA